ncbi:unnamed protein product [Candidula unifasciata]|uniref:Uncharacterized protein n=1 Tax=Candidula unifasciata TaxID=100452 RepID=A0A8S3ZXZ3_9EUPU|nr:unnamed protein product [Candidula unifasciata]
MMETFLEDAENSLHHRTNAHNGSGSSGESEEDPMDDPFIYDKFLQDPDWAKAAQEDSLAKNLVDPGPFRYNKRIFMTSLPALLLVLALGGETLVLMVAVGTALIAVMAQLGDSRRCVIIFVIIFIPTHVYVLASVVPLLWLSLWHFFLVALINLFVVLTAGWVLLQFKAFRMEEPTLAVMTEQLLFTAYPFICTCLVCWALATVMSVSVIPTVFSFMWFVLLQLYLLPIVSSFKTQAAGDDNLDVVQVPVVVATVIVFVLLGPILQILLSALSVDTPAVLSVIFFVHLIFMMSLTLFLSTLLSIRQIFEYLGLPYSTAVYVRWGSGVSCTLLCYPVLQAFGLDSHFLPLLPVAIGIFAALGVVLAFKKRRVVMAVLAVVLVTSLVALFILWIQGMPHNLKHYFIGMFPLNAFYLMICVNFLLCLLCLWMATVDARDMFGALLVLQAIVLTVCEISLHSTNLYSTSRLQLTSVTASYTIHRLHVAEKISRKATVASSAVHVAKSLASAMSLIIDRNNGEITFLEMAALGLMIYVVLSVFVYGVTGDKSGFEIASQLLMLLGVLAVNSHHFLLPLSMLMFQGSASYTDVIGLWCMLGGGLALLYSRTISSVHTRQVLKLALILGVMGIVIIVVHPPLSFTAYSVFQWLEIISIFILAVILSLKVELSPQMVVVISHVLAVCLGLRICIYLWAEVTLLYAVLCVVDSIAVLILVFVCVVITEMTDISDRIMKISIATAVSCSICLLIADVVGYFSSSPSHMPLSLLQLPAWKAVLVTFLLVSVILKVVHSTKGPDKLPMTSEDSPGRVTLPLIGNLCTVITFLVACSQGPADPTLHDLWCCAWTVVLACLHQDTIFLRNLAGSKQASPIIMASVATLVISTIIHSRLWLLACASSIIGGFTEVLLVFLTFPVFYAAWVILWEGKVVFEPAVVFLTPYSLLLVMLATTYTAWILAAACLVMGFWMMKFKLPMVPYNSDPADHYR